jgi:hypothetical protein
MVSGWAVTLKTWRSISSEASSHAELDPTYRIAHWVFMKEVVDGHDASRRACMYQLLDSKLYVEMSAQVDVERCHGQICGSFELEKVRRSSGRRFSDAREFWTARRAWADHKHSVSSAPPSCPIFSQERIYPDRTILRHVCCSASQPEGRVEGRLRRVWSLRPS